ncbi:MAG: hypothetical protein DRJ56_02895 [Thermoprotei archaeon]|nr:MAG: hypothetical protein DRJ56_02895 [Thermoprotei archaeon]
MTPLKLSGIIPATVLPMDESFRICEGELEDYIRWLMKFRVGGLAVNVDTGEGPHLYPEERRRVLEIVTDVVKGRVPVVAGLAASFTDQAVRLAREAKEAGADALLVFPIPAFRGPRARGVICHYYRAVAEGAGIDLVAFQLQPELGGVIFDEETLAALASIERVVALKEASFDARVFSDTMRVLRRAERRVALLTGNDNFILESLIMGADGALIGFGTVATDLQVEMFDLVKRRRYEEAWEIYERLKPLADAIFAPPVRNYRARLKEALAALGVIEHTYVRPPLLPISEEEREAVRRALREAGLL